MTKVLFMLFFGLMAINSFSWTTPTYSSPMDEGVVWTGLTFNWNSVISSEFYEIQIDTVDTFDSPEFQNDIEAYINSSSSNSDTEEYITDLLFGQTYYWRVRAWVMGDTSVWTSVRSIDTRDYVNLFGPSDEASTWTGVTFNWNTHLGVDFYELQLDTSVTFDSPEFQNDIEAYINSSSSNSDTDEYITDLLFGQTYYWKVRAINAVDTSEWSVVRTIETRDYVTLFTPVDLATSAPLTGVYLNWNAHYGVDFYEVEWDTTNLFNSAILGYNIETYINTSSSNGDTDHFTGTLLDNQTYFWRVRAINAIDTSAWSNRIFSTGDIITIPETPTLINPFNSETNVAIPVNFDWENALNANSYELNYSLDSDFSSFISEAITPSNFTAAGLLSGETYYWRVKSINGGFHSDWSETWHFTTDCAHSESTINVEECSSYTSPSGDYAWNETGVYSDVIPNMAGCDSLITINLTINSNSGTEFIEVCDSYTWINGVTYFESTTSPVHTLTNDAGCDSVVTLNLIITPAVDVSTTTTGETITANLDGTSYQWLDCDNGYSEIPGETNQSLTVSENGNYAVRITDACVDTSECVLISTISIDELSPGNQTYVYPNPSFGNINVTLNELKNVTIRITNLMGEMVFIAENINQPIYTLELIGPPGLYLIEIRSESKSKYHKLIKQ